MHCPYLDARLLDAALTELGRDQARRAGEELVALEGCCRVQRVYVSPLRRALETAALAFEAYHGAKLAHTAATAAHTVHDR